MSTQKLTYEQLISIGKLRQLGMSWIDVVKRLKLKSTKKSYMSSPISFLYEKMRDNCPKGREAIIKDFPDLKEAIEQGLLTGELMRDKYMLLDKKTKKTEKPKRTKSITVLKRKTKPSNRKQRPYSVKKETIDVRFEGELDLIPLVLHDEFKRIVRIGHQICKDYGRTVKGWKVTIAKRKTTRRFGDCWYGRKEIRLFPNGMKLYYSRYELEQGNPYDINKQIVTTLIHEFAHALTPGHNHGAKFRSVYRDYLRRYGLRIPNDNYKMYAQKVDWIDEPRF